MGRAGSAEHFGTSVKAVHAVGVYHLVLGSKPGTLHCVFSPGSVVASVLAL